MKKFILRTERLAIALLLLVAVSCTSDEDTIDPTPTDPSNITADITEDTTISSDAYLSGEITVKSGVTLTIEPGVTITANADKLTYLLVEQGAVIDAEGTASEPITFTSDVQESGAWGGLHICGYAPINSGDTGTSEIGNSIYGGTDSDDNSGTLKYVVVEYSGTVLDDTHEANGISLYGVGAGTTLDYIQIYIGNDDGIEFFGGTVDIKHTYVYGAGDDSFDWTEGWSGNGQYLIAEQIENIGDRAIEGDNLKSNNLADPFSTPTLSNLTLIGNGTDGNYGIKLREGTKGQIYNFIVSNFAKRSINVEHEQTLINVNNSELICDYAYINSDVSDAAIKYSASVDEDGNSIGDVQDVDEEFKFENSDNITQLPLTGTAVTVSTTYSGGVDMTTLTSIGDRATFFTSDSNIGAGSEWLTGWSR